ARRGTSADHRRAERMTTVAQLRRVHAQCMPSRSAHSQRPATLPAHPLHPQAARHRGACGHRQRCAWLRSRGTNRLACRLGRGGRRRASWHGLVEFCGHGTQPVDICECIRRVNLECAGNDGYIRDLSSPLVPYGESDHWLASKLAGELEERRNIGPTERNSESGDLMGSPPDDYRNIAVWAATDERNFILRPWRGQWCRFHFVGRMPANPANYALLSHSSLTSSRPHRNATVSVAPKQIQLIIRPYPAFLRRRDAKMLSPAAHVCDDAACLFCDLCIARAGQQGILLWRPWIAANEWLNAKFFSAVVHRVRAPADVFADRDIRISPEQRVILGAPRMMFSGGHDADSTIGSMPH